MSQSTPLSTFVMVCLAVQASAIEIPVFIFAGQSITINSGPDSAQLAPELLAPQTNVLFYNARTHYATTTTPH
jgi:hypothetical protein